METAGGADKPGFKIGEPNFARPSITVDLDGMRAVIVRAIDQQGVDAGGAHFGEGDFLRSGLHALRQAAEE